MGGKWTTESKEFATLQENRTDLYFEFLTGVTGWFSSFTANPRNSTIDYTYVDAKGNTGVLESKIRKCTFDRWDDMFIEIDKYKALTGATLTNDKATYINFFDDNFNEFWIVDIKKTMNKEPEIQRNIYIRNLNLPTENNYIDDRFLIPKSIGKHFKINKLTNKYEEIK